MPQNQTGDTFTSYAYRGQARCLIRSALNQEDNNRSRGGESNTEQLLTGETQRCKFDTCFASTTEKIQTTATATPAALAPPKRAALQCRYPPCGDGNASLPRPFSSFHWGSRKSPKETYSWLNHHGEALQMCTISTR